MKGWFELDISTVMGDTVALDPDCGETEQLMTQRALKAWRVRLTSTLSVRNAQ